MLKMKCDREIHAYGKGFTLMEMLAVLMVVGILAVIAVTKYSKTAENSYADKARAMVQLVYTANRMYKMNNPTQPYAQGAIDANSPLVTGGYIQNLAAVDAQYDYRGANDGSASVYIACAGRREGDNDVWFYRINVNGQLCSGALAPQAQGITACAGGGC